MLFFGVRAAPSPSIRGLELFFKQNGIFYGETKYLNSNFKIQFLLKYIVFLTDLGLLLPPTPPLDWGPLGVSFFLLQTLSAGVAFSFWASSSFFPEI